MSMPLSTLYAYAWRNLDEEENFITCIYDESAAGQVLVTIIQKHVYILTKVADA
jgi:hypothetical protein